MRTALGSLLVMIGLAMAVLWLPERDSEHQLAVITEIATQGIARVAAPNDTSGDKAGRTFSPQTPLITAAARGTRRCRRGARQCCRHRDDAAGSDSGCAAGGAGVQDRGRRAVGCRGDERRSASCWRGEDS